MTVQLPLPAGWARNYISKPDPRDRLEALVQDKLDAKAAIRSVLDALAEKHDVTVPEVTRAMLSVDDTIGDLTYERERALQHEVEDQEPVHC